MDHEYKLRKELDKIETDNAQNKANIDILMKRPYTRYGKVLRLLDDDTCDVREVESNKVYYNVPILNGVNLERYTVVVIGFMNNSFLNPFIVGGLNVIGSKLDAILAPLLDDLEDMIQYNDDVKYDLEQKLGLTLTSTRATFGYHINAVLTYDEEVYTNKPLDLYIGDTFIDTQITDDYGTAIFNVDPEELTIYTVKYKSVISETIVINISTYTWVLDGVVEPLIVFDGGSATVGNGLFEGQGAYVDSPVKIDCSRTWELDFELDFPAEHRRSRFMLRSTDSTYFEKTIQVTFGGELNLVVNGEIIGQSSMGVGGLSGAGWNKFKLRKQDGSIQLIREGYQSSTFVNNSTVNNMGMLDIGVGELNSYSYTRVRNVTLNYTD